MAGVCPVPLRVVPRLALTLLLAIAVVGPAASANSPCPPRYSVHYADSTWTLMLGFLGPPYPIANISYWAPWNGTYEPLLPHVNRTPGPVERVAFQDRVFWGNLTGSDELQVWDPDRSLGNFTIALGPPGADDQTFRLEVGYSEAGCPPPPWWSILADPLVLACGGLIIVLVALPIYFVLRAGRRRRG